MGIERWESYVSRYEKKMKHKLDDEVKLAGLESLVPEELEKHLILNSNRLRTFEDARLEVVSYVEAKFGLRIRDSKPSDTGARDTRIPWMLMQSTLSSAIGTGSSSLRDGGFKCGGAHCQRDCNARKRHRQAIVWQRQAEASHGPRVSPHSQAKAREKKTREKPKDSQKEQMFEPRCQRLTQRQNIENRSLRS